MVLRRSRKTKASRDFWDELDRNREGEGEGDLPYLGEPVWESKYELSPALLNISDEDYYKENK